MSSAHVQELRGHYVRRLPTSADISTRSPIVLTERDRQLLVAVHQHGFLTTDFVELAFFPPSNGSRSSASSKAYERLRELWLWGYVERVAPTRPPRARRTSAVPVFGGAPGCAHRRAPNGPGGAARPASATRSTGSRFRR